MDGNTEGVSRGVDVKPAHVHLVRDLMLECVRPPMVPSAVAWSLEGAQRPAIIPARSQGWVDVGGRTWQGLIGQMRASGPPVLPKPMPPTGGGEGLTEADFKRAAEKLGCEVACIKAVNEVESGKSGFLVSGKPKILFEAHIFSKQTQHKYDTDHPDISSPRWNKALYAGGEKEYQRLEKAMALDRAAALKSASWGRFQIMGFNHAAAGFASVDAYVEAMYRSEGAQLDAFVAFLIHSKLVAPLKEKRWADFARGYNGSGYAANKYDVKLKAAYEKHAKGD